MTSMRLENCQLRQWDARLLGLGGGGGGPEDLGGGAQQEQAEPLLPLQPAVDTRINLLCTVLLLSWALPLYGGWGDFDDKDSEEEAWEFDADTQVDQKLSGDSQTM